MLVPLMLPPALMINRLNNEPAELIHHTELPAPIEKMFRTIESQ